MGSVRGGTRVHQRGQSTEQNSPNQFKTGISRDRMPEVGNWNSLNEFLAIGIWKQNKRRLRHQYFEIMI